MNEQSFSDRADFQPLPNKAIVYRALLRKPWINEDTGLVESEAYYLRKNKNEPGISVNIASACSPEQCAARFRTCYGVARLEVGGIRELGLDVIPDSISHAEIAGLPYDEDDPEMADLLADLLAQQSLIVWKPRDLNL